MKKNCVFSQRKSDSEREMTRRFLAAGISFTQETVKTAGGSVDMCVSVLCPLCVLSKCVSISVLLSLKLKEGR